MSMWEECAEGQCVRRDGEGNWLGIRKGAAEWQMRKAVPQRKGIWRFKDQKERFIIKSESRD